MTVPPREVYDPHSNDPGLQPLIVIVRCARCAERYGEARARQFGRLAYSAGNMAHGVRSAETGERLQGWAWFPLEGKRTPNSVPGAPGVAKSYSRGVRTDVADASGLELRCPVCRWVRRVGMVRLQELAAEAVTRGQRSIFA